MGWLDAYVGLGAALRLRQSDGAKTQTPVSGPPPPQAARIVDAKKAVINLRMSVPIWSGALDSVGECDRSLFELEAPTCREVICDA